MQGQVSESAPARDGGSAGPLGPHIPPFIEQLVRLGYRRATLSDQRSLVRTFDRWITDHHVTLADVDEHVVDAFLDAPASGRRRQRGSGATLHRLLAYLRAHSLTRATEVIVDDPWLAQLERRYQHYLRAERGLCATTVQTYVWFLRQFVSEHVGAAAVSMGTVSASDVATFVRRHARAASPGRAQLMTTALRALFRFLFQAGELGVDLSLAVPTVPAWRLATLPRSLAPDHVERLLAACDRQTATGRRDYAILLLLARLGLRAGEVVALELDDLHWRPGEITIRGKTCESSTPFSSSETANVWRLSRMPG